jgi:hypothetical protein
MHRKRALSCVELPEEGCLRLKRHLDVRTPGARALRLDRRHHPRPPLGLPLCTHTLFRCCDRLLGRSRRGSPHAHLLTRDLLKLGFQILDLLPEPANLALEIGHHVRALFPRLLHRTHRQPLVVPRAQRLFTQRFKRRLERRNDARASLGLAARSAVIAATSSRGLGRRGMSGLSHVQAEECGGPVIRAWGSLQRRPVSLLVPRR